MARTQDDAQPVGSAGGFGEQCAAVGGWSAVAGRTWTGAVETVGGGWR
jgi:hypothetical protein